MLTQNKFVRSIVNGIKLKFIETPVQTRTPPPLRFTDTEAACVDQEVESLLKKGAIHRLEPCNGQFVSNIFLWPKKSEIFGRRNFTPYHLPQKVKLIH